MQIKKKQNCPDSRWHDWECWPDRLLHHIRRGCSILCFCICCQGIWTAKTKQNKEQNKQNTKIKTRNPLFKCLSFFLKVMSTWLCILLIQVSLKFLMHNKYKYSSFRRSQYHRFWRPIAKICILALVLTTVLPLWASFLTSQFNVLNYIMLAIVPTSLGYYYWIMWKYVRT